VAGEAELSLEVGVDEGRDRICLSRCRAGHVTAPVIARPERPIA
jgi:hypothetical protein